MAERLLTLPSAFDPSSQAYVGAMAASFDDQFRRLRHTVAGLGVEHLEWQERPGRNTIGMLMAHLAGTEIGWFYVVGAGLSYEEGKRVVREHIGIDRDGIPLSPDGVHPENLSGWPLERYIDVLERARRATHDELAHWDDASLDATLTFGPLTVSRRWVLYHILEHFAAHYGQILSLLHCMHDHGVPGLPERRPVL